MIMFRKEFLLIPFVLLFVSIVSAEPVRVDLSQNGDVEEGWIDWNTGGVRLGNADVSRQFLNEAEFDNDFTIDFIKIDSRNRGQVNDSIALHDLLEDGFKDDNAFDMVIKGLAAGDYVMTSYHHDTNEDVVNDDGTINISVKDADGERVVVDHLQQSWGPNPKFVGIAIFAFRSDGVSDVVITFVDNNDGINNEAHINGFVIDVPVSLEKASNPKPVDKAEDVPRDITLSWTKGISADKHDVYLGTVFDDVNDAGRTNPLGVLVSQNQGPSFYALPERLAFNTTYYWHVDEVNGPPDYTIFEGDVWQFTTEPIAYVVEDVTASASSSEAGKGPENTVNGSGLDESGLLHGNTGKEAMWISVASEPRPAWIEFEFDKVHKLQEMWVWNSNESLEKMIGVGFKDVTIEYSLDGTEYATLGTTHEFARAPGTPDYAHNTTVDFSGAAAKFVRLTANSNWGGIFPQYGLSEVRFFYIPVHAREPEPDSGATDVEIDVALGFRAGREAAQHNLYFSEDQQAVIDGTAPVNTITESGYGPLSLDLGVDYFWRVDEVNDAETPATWQGDIWNFLTQEFLVVDDFEDYNEFEPFTVYNTWTDGYQDTTNGSTIGYVLGNPQETDNVHGGEQSVPVMYDNSAASFSEVAVSTDALAIGRNWSKGGAKTLVMWFHGDPANAATEQMYVKVNGSKVLYNGDTADIGRPRWKQWNIDLAAFSTNLGNVTQLSIGFERTSASGGSGTVLIDDIRLYRAAPESPEEVFFEAEAAETITPPMQVYDDPAASGGQYIARAPGNNSGDAPPAEGVATYSVTVQGGIYKIIGRAFAADGSNDSFWLRILDSTGQKVTTNTINDSSGWVKWNGIDDNVQWHWEDVFSDDDGDLTVHFMMATGTYTLEIAYRDGCKLDAFVISKID